MRGSRVSVSIGLSERRNRSGTPGWFLLTRDVLRRGRAKTSLPIAPAVSSLLPAEAGHGAGSQPVIVEECCGWLHSPGTGNGATAVASDVAVLLCPALGWDGLHAHHGYRLLADQFASAGYPTLRFQYPGTGDSGEIEAGAGGTVEHWAAWQRSVQDAANWLRVTTGASRLILVGLRFGATLAAAVAEQRADVDGLVLLAPVLRGKSYMRQLDMEARLESGAAPAQAGGIEFHELNLSATTVALISKVDLRQAKLRADLQVAIFPQAPSSLVEGCVQAWTSRGVPVHCAGFEGLEPLLQEAIHCDQPPVDVTSVLAWAAQHVPARARSAPGMPIYLPSEANLVVGDCTETPVRFGDGDKLFGVLCRPSDTVASRVVIIGNTGRDPHYGIARFGVQLARDLASVGIASLRVDFAGLGDSPAKPGETQALSSLFETDRVGDVSAAIDRLAQLGFREFAIQGVCSGAYHAFQAVQVDQRLSTVMLVNLPVFEWQGGHSIKEAIWQSAPPSRLFVRLMDAGVWRRALRGNVEFRPVVQALARYLGNAARALGRRTAAQPAAETSPVTPVQIMATLAERRVNALFLYSSTDPGIDTLNIAFGPQGERLRSVGGVDLRIVPGLDHVLSGRIMREKVCQHLVGFMTAGSTPAATCRTAQ
jgi:alpha-beta hydrolase superfamily lysophospholipase